MKYSGVGGQAVMEGVMMRNGEKYAVAVRKPNQEIDVEVFSCKGLGKFQWTKKVPILRGVVNFVDSLYLGMTTLMHSASFFEEEEEQKATTGMTEEEKKIYQEKQKKEEKAVMGGTVVASIVLAVAIFFILPYGISLLIQQFIHSQTLIALIEGLIRLAIFVSYVGLISFMEDIRRTYMYHGAEHKCINCIEHGMELNVENVRSSSKQHKRCGTSFLLIVMLISIFFFMFIRVESPILRLIVRLLLIPVIAGVSYEIIRFAGKFDNWFVNLISAPGLILQKLTTREPDDAMIEVAIASVEAVFDWKEWQKENIG